MSSVQESWLKIMCVFEAGARIRASGEVIGLACQIYHRFMHINHEAHVYDNYTLSAACLKLAHWFYEKSFDEQDMVLIMHALANGSENSPDRDHVGNLIKSIDIATRVISINLNFDLDHRDTKMITPGELRRQLINKATGNVEVEISSESDDDDPISDRLLEKNPKTVISSHRYLLHYLYSIKLLVTDEEMQPHFHKFCNVAWTILNDCYWSASVQNFYAHHLACASLMMSVEISQKTLKCTRDKPGWQLWKIINRKWNLIFCNDLPDKSLDMALDQIIKQYQDYERLLEHELNTYVIDPETKI